MAIKELVYYLPLRFQNIKVLFITFLSMNNISKIIIWTALFLSPTLSFAKTVAAIPTVLPVKDVVTETTKVDPNRVMPPIENTQKTYTFDQAETKRINGIESSLLKVNCDGVQVLKDLGFTQNTSNIYSLGVSEWAFDYNFDLRNCSLWGSKQNQNWNGKSVTEAQAMAAAKAFMGSKYLANKIFSQYGAPIIIAKNGNNPRPYYADMKSSISKSSSIDGIEIDPTDTWEVQAEYVSFSIMFPYTINGKQVYNNYGNKAGITLEVTAEGVTSINAQLLPFKGAVRKADKMSADDISSYVKKGGNNPYRGQDSKVDLGKPQQILVLFSLRRNNINEMYLSSGIKFSTSLKPDQWAQQPYEMTLSDYKVGNNNYGY